MLSGLLTTFLSVAEHQSFTRAAEELYTTQPTISRQIHQLEEELGFPLFQRGYKKIALTPEGKIMLQSCRQMKEIFQQGLQEARKCSSQMTGVVKMGILSSLDEGKLLFPSLAELDKLYPNIRVEIEKASHSQLRKGLQSGRYDAIVTLSFEAELLTDVQVKRMEQVKCYFILSDRHPLYTKEDLQFSDIANCRFVLPSPLETPRREADLRHILKNFGASDPKIVFEPNMESLMFHVRTGKSVALLNYYENNLFSPVYRRVELPDSMLDALYIVTIWKAKGCNPLVPLLF